ncbi:hypothetical protein AUEXF2481DRAFT_41527 [Aureobasidium subglaciale EXF-2481]|uniref:Protein kinase domain-containing protein n=1 Tax=Aureobasidium subglaciale (strain EXF-2481) TaxID=1043005 RepID=A0A074Y7W9_AURSE|nr:uncharacterized protein AUEXF2481DRAFT_41527 [Aureobasidium subglaciale EXF-2481]KEQ93795.1 hypothetical protein AUEXF2481DRAFT_41527 [Aureobasidium subglaciale EXF-2481]
MRLMSVLPENNWRTPDHGYAVPVANQLRHNRRAHLGVRELGTHAVNPGPKKYSNVLVDIVCHCLRPDRINRPSAALLLQTIQTNANFQGMDIAGTGAGGVITPAMRKQMVMLGDDRWAIGNPRP